MSPNLLEKAAARSWDPKVACMVTLTLVFLCGAAAGAVAMNFGVHNRLHQPAFDTPPAGNSISRGCSANST
jgi:hypothetical protein